MGAMKIRSDASIVGNISGIGVLIWNDKNEIQAALVDLHTVVSPLLAEILVIRKGLHLASRLGLRKVEVESDSVMNIRLCSNATV